MPEQNKQLVRRFARELLNAENPAAVDELLAEDFVLRLPGHAPIEGRDAFSQAIEDWRRAFPDWRVSVEELIAEGDRVAARWRCEATHEGELMGIPATGKRVTWTANDILRIQGDKIVENKAEEDMLGLMRQLGAVPEPAAASST